MAIYRLEEVFGIKRELPLNYIERPYVDELLIESLECEKHIVIYGSSKQGKTCLRKKCIRDEQFITVQCLNTHNIKELYAAILKNAGYILSTSNKRTIRGDAKVEATVGWNIFSKAELQGAVESSYETEVNCQPLDLNLEDVNDVINALKRINFNKFILSEDFHYLNIDTQRDFAFALKAFFENSKILFVIIGVWLEENRLISLNGDLAGRVISINADKWERDCLIKVIKEGNDLLNIKFSDDLIDKIIEETYDNVYLVQETCYKICEIMRVKVALADSFYIGADSFKLKIYQIVREIVNQHTGRYNSFITQFADGLPDTELEMYKWVIYSIICVEPDELQQSLKFSRIKKLITDKYPRDVELNPVNLINALKAFTSLQVEKRITPNILDYDQTSLRLSIVDKGFIIWLTHQKKDELLASIGLEDCSLISDK